MKYPSLILLTIAFNSYSQTNLKTNVISIPKKSIMTEEDKQKHREWVDKYDINKNGKLDFMEIEAFYREERDKLNKKLIEKYDINKNGKLQYSELELISEEDRKMMREIGLGPRWFHRVKNTNDVINPPSKKSTLQK